MPRDHHPQRAPAAQFALRFRLLMSYHNLTLKDIATATRSGVSTVGTWKNGRVPSSRQTLEDLAEVFQVSVEYLLTGQHPPAPNGAAEKLAAYVLDDLHLLRQVLQEDRPAMAAPPPHKAGLPSKPGGKGRYAAKIQVVSRREVEDYLRTYLDRAERAPGGLAHAWVQLRREFPLDLHDRLRG